MTTHKERHPAVIRRRRGVALPACSVYVGRPTIWGNPFVIGNGVSREDAVRLYREWAYDVDNEVFREAVRERLRGKDLACWCAPLACHADVLLEIANG